MVTLIRVISSDNGDKIPIKMNLRKLEAEMESVYTAPSWDLAAKTHNKEKTHNHRAWGSSWGVVGACMWTDKNIPVEGETSGHRNAMNMNKRPGCLTQHKEIVPRNTSRDGVIRLGQGRFTHL